MSGGEASVLVQLLTEPGSADDSKDRRSWHSNKKRNRRHVILPFLKAFPGPMGKIESVHIWVRSVESVQTGLTLSFSQSLVGWSSNVPALISVSVFAPARKVVDCHKGVVPQVLDLAAGGWGEASITIVRGNQSCCLHWRVMNKPTITIILIDH